MLLARHFGKKCLIYFATDDFKRDKPAAPPDDRAASQSAFTTQVKAPVGSVHEFRASILLTPAAVCCRAGLVSPRSA
jgi:hypothetical protein